MTVINTTDENFNNDVLNSKGTILVDFWAEWCPPCLRIAPILEEVSNEANITICKLDIVANPQTMETYNVRGLPSLLLFKDGQLVDRKVGALSKAQILDFVQTDSEKHE